MNTGSAPSHTIGLALAGEARLVWGLEISEEAVVCAIENAELNGIENARFFAGNVGQTVEQLVDSRILKGFTFHDVAPVACGVADGEEDRTIFVFRSLQRFLAPRVPVHGVVEVLQ